MDDDELLEGFFEAGRKAAPEPSSALMARIAADAADAQAGSAAPVRGRPRAGLAGLFAALGGWPGFAGLATATLAGIWIGVAQPMGVDPLALVAGDAALDLTQGYGDLDWGEG